MSNLVEETIHGTTVVDPYRWLEDRSSTATEEWIQNQQGRYENYFRGYEAISVLEDRVRHYLDTDLIDQPSRVGNRYFYRRRNPGQEQASIRTRLVGEETEFILVDPKLQGRFTSVGIYRISPDGNYLAYESKSGGEDQKEIRIVHVASGDILDSRIARGHSRGLCFVPGGYFYCQESGQVAMDHQIRQHSFGFDAPDRVVFRAPKSAVSRLLLLGNAKHLVAVWIHEGDSNLLVDLFLSSVDEPMDWRVLAQGKSLPFHPLLLGNQIFVFTETLSGSPRVIEIAVDGSGLGEVLPPQNASIRGFAFLRDQFFVSSFHNNVTKIDRWSYAGERLGSLDLPSGGTVRLLPPVSEDAEHFFYSFESFTVPLTLFEYCPYSDSSTVWHMRGSVPVLDACAVREVNYASKDGTMIPLTLVCRKEEQLSRTSALVMTGYGGFGAAVTPQFSVLATILMDYGVVLALPHIRGGGEFGKEWRDAGRREKRQNAFDDFIAAAEWLCRNGLTQSDRFGIFGGSNGGLLAATAMTQCPELFRAVLCIAPLLDMLRYERFDDAARWRDEYGSIENPGDFHALLQYSPYHHVDNDIDYPSVMFVTGDKDDRCNPAHVRKMAARLQDRTCQKSPAIVDYSEYRGHSPVLPLSIRVTALGHRLAFLCKELSIPIVRSNGNFRLGGTDATRL
jgi:prolyl oligopeptidase